MKCNIFAAIFFRSSPEIMSRITVIARHIQIVPTETWYSPKEIAISIGGKKYLSNLFLQRRIRYVKSTLSKLLTPQARNIYCNKDCSMTAGLTASRAEIAIIEILLLIFHIFAKTITVAKTVSI